ncbi:hypothetical protein ADEAN_000143700 [Angomonas deanei]|uniref:Uncharacterized protein n=1 Tax=Angomonas deanei TaxID=59799 RepID=A0A7G2C5G4_9TRYP|nr:hypothetical protein ADEAN_000143700 [Angomonas deanei]
MQSGLNEKVSHHATPTRGQRRTPVKQTRTPNRTPSPPVKRPDQHSAEALADMLGILWPPTGTKLYFLNGTRLTAAQVDNFYETVDLQNKATELKQTGLETVLRATKDKKRRILSPSKLREVSPTDGSLTLGGIVPALLRETKGQRQASRTTDKSAERGV